MFFFFWMVLFSPTCTLQYTTTLHINKNRNLLFVLCSYMYICIFRYSFEAQLYRFIEYNCKFIFFFLNCLVREDCVDWGAFCLLVLLISYVYSFPQGNCSYLLKKKKKKKKAPRFVQLASSVITSIVEMFLANKQIPCWFQGRVN